MDNSLDLSIIIVNWNSKEYLRKCLTSLLAGVNDMEIEIIVIDNASFDGCGEMLKRHYPQVRFIQNKNNDGFAKANNVAFKVSRSRNILFLNPDTEPDGAAVATMSHWLDELPDAGAVGAKLLNSDGSVQTTSIRAFPKILNLILDSDALRTAFPSAGIWGAAPLYTDERKPAKVDTISGASLMVKRSVFEAVGMFSTDYFMYSEDVDLCYKIQEAGLKTYYIPTAIIVHHGGASSSQTGENAFTSVMMWESRWRFFRKTRSRWYCRLYRATQFIESMMRIGLASLVWPVYRLRGRENSVRNVLKKWIARLRWTLGGESWVKNY